MKGIIEEILTKYQLSSAQFADLIGVQRSSISHILSGRNKPSFDFIHKILLKYPEINAHYLITGQGSLENTSLNSIPSSKSSEEQDLFNQNTDIKEDTLLNNEAKNLITSVNLDENVTERDNEKGRVTNVNKVKFIIFVYKDDSFKIINSR